MFRGRRQDGNMVPACGLSSAFQVSAQGQPCHQEINCPGLFLALSSLLSQLLSLLTSYFSPPSPYPRPPPLVPSLPPGEPVCSSSDSNWKGERNGEVGTLDQEGKGKAPGWPGFRAKCLKIIQNFILGEFTHLRNFHIQFC